MASLPEATRTGKVASADLRAKSRLTAMFGPQSYVTLSPTAKCSKDEPRADAAGAKGINRSLCK